MLVMLRKGEGISESEETSESSPDEEQLRICSKPFLKWVQIEVFKVYGLIFSQWFHFTFSNLFPMWSASVTVYETHKFECIWKGFSTFSTTSLFHYSKLIWHMFNNKQRFTNISFLKLLLVVYMCRNPTTLNVQRPFRLNVVFETDTPTSNIDGDISKMLLSFE